MENFAELKELLTQPKKILITSHANPDGDAIGSSLGLFHFLKELGHDVTVILPTEMPDFFDFLPSYQDILIYEKSQTSCIQLIEQSEIIFALDYNHFNRTEHMEASLSSSNAYKVMIDHHLGPDSFPQARLWKTEASSTCELVYEFIDLFKYQFPLSIDILNCLYVGILTDTGGFQYATTPALFRMVAEMTEKGLNPNLISDLVNNAYSYKRFRLLGFSIYEKLELLEDINTGIIVLNLNDHKDFTIQRGDLEGIVNMVLKIRKIKCAVLITERKDRVKLSFRSKGDFSVQKICAEHFNGGGHQNASGGQSKEPLSKVITKLKQVLYANQELLA